MGKTPPFCNLLDVLLWTPLTLDLVPSASAWLLVSGLRCPVRQSFLGLPPVLICYIKTACRTAEMVLGTSPLF